MPVLLMFLSLSLLYGCKSQLDFQTLIDKEQARSTEQMAEAIARMNEKEDALPISKNMYRRQLSLKFNQHELTISKQHEQIISLFFGSLPESQHLNIIISVAPSSGAEPFKILNDSWTRLQNLKKMLDQYSQEIELVYQTNLDIDSATIHAVGGGTPGVKSVQ